VFQCGVCMCDFVTNSNPPNALLFPITAHDCLIVRTITIVSTAHTSRCLRCIKGRTTAVFISFCLNLRNAKGKVNSKVVPMLN
jgi:hypothetical protein